MFARAANAVWSWTDDWDAQIALHVLNSGEAGIGLEEDGLYPVSSAARLGLERLGTSGDGALPSWRTDWRLRSSRGRPTRTTLDIVGPDLRPSDSVTVELP